MIGTKDEIIRIVESAIKGEITYDEFDKAIGLNWWYDRVTSFNQIELLISLKKRNQNDYYNQRFNNFVCYLANIVNAK